MPVMGLRPGKFTSFTGPTSTMALLPITAHDYYERLPEERQLPMARIRQMIRKHWPRTREDMANGFPTYHLGGQALFAVSSQKNHITFYVLPPGMLSVFNQDLRARDHGKSCVRFRRLDDEDLGLLHRIVLYVGTTLTVASRETRKAAEL